MDIDSALKAADGEDIRNRCHVNSNEDGDRFVGVKADSDKAMVYFPIGYQLPETDQEIRTDIKHLIQVLSEFTSKEDRLLSINKFAAPQTVDFPINAYRAVMYHYTGNPLKSKVALANCIEAVLKRPAVSPCSKK